MIGRLRAAVERRVAEQRRRVDAADRRFAALTGREAVSEQLDPRFGLPIGGNWEGGYTLPDGTRMVHEPWVGWVIDRCPFCPPSVPAIPSRRMSWWRRFLPPWRQR